MMSGITFSDFIPPLGRRVARRLRRMAGGRGDATSAPSLQPFMHPRLGSSSQHHEDLLIDLLLGVKSHGFYVDVGANDPVFNSNTDRFYRRGWRGINAEPNPEPFKKISAARPHDTNLNVALSDHTATMTFYQVVGDSTLSSLDEAVARRMAARFGLGVEPIKIAVQTLAALLSEHADGKSIDFMSVDAEGVDVEVLRGNDWTRFRPTLVLVEMQNSPTAIVDLLQSHDYVLVFNNHVNGLFMDQAKLETSTCTAEPAA